MSMKLSYRDKVIIIVVAVLVILGVGIFCFAKPKYEDLQVAKQRLAAKEDEQKQVEDKMGTLDDLKKQLETQINAIVDDQDKFLSEKDTGETYQISKYLMETLSPISGFNITGLKMDPLDSKDLEAYYYNKKAISYPLKINGDIANKLPPEVGYATDGSWPDAPASVKVGGTVATVSYECNNDAELLDAIQLIADNEKNIYLLTFSGSYLQSEDAAASDEPKFKGDLTIAVYEIYPLDPADIDAAPAVLTNADEAAAQ